MSFRRYAREIGCASSLLAAAFAPSGCSSGSDTPSTPAAVSGTSPGGASGAGTAGTNAVAGSSAGVGTIAGAAGAMGGSGGSAVAGAGGAAAGGAGAGGANGGANGGGGAAGSSGGGGSGAQGGAMSCAGNVISLSANGTGSDPDTAAARVVIDMMTDLPLGNANRTIEFWADIKPTDWVGEKNEVYVYGDLNTNAAAFGLDFGTFAVKNMPTNHATLNPVTGGGFNDDSTNDLGITSATRQWVHIAMVWGGTAIKTYVNGALKITSPGMNGATMLATTASPITFGYSPANKNCFNGNFDELRIWKTARTDAEISGNYDKNVAPDDPNLVGYWKFDEAPGATMAADSVTTAGHTPHPGVLTSAMPAGLPTFITPMMPAPIHCR